MMDFNSWKRRVNAMILRATGLPSDDLTDFAYREAWDRGEPPASTAYDVLVANGYYA